MTRGVTQVLAVNMRLLWIFLFLGCLFNASHAVLQDYSSTLGIGAGDLVNNVGLDTGSLQNNLPEGNPPGEFINLVDDSGKLAEVIDQLPKVDLPSISPEDLNLTSSLNISGISQDIVDEYGQRVTSALDSLDTSDLTNQLSAPVLNQDLLAQEGLVGIMILNNKDLIKDREELLHFLQGGSPAFGNTDALLEAAGPEALKGLLCKGSLGGLCGHGSLVGMNEALKNMDSGKDNRWVNVTNFNIFQVSWRLSATSSHELHFQTKLTLSFSGLLMFLSGSSVDVSIVAPFGLEQTEPGQVVFALQKCQVIFTRIQVRAGMLSRVMKLILRVSLNISLRNILCPVVRFWFYIINQQLALLRTISSLGALQNASLPGSQGPVLYERTYRLDFKNKTFPASFINWLIKSPSL